MSKPKLLEIGKTFLSKHTPEILTGIGIAGMITTTILAVKATPKAIKKIEEVSEEKGETPTVVETAKACWKYYIPAATSCALSTACLIGANSVNARRTAALATAYTLSETALSEYREKVVETIGEKKEKAVREEVAKERMTKDPVTTKEIIVTGDGNTLCYDYHFGRYFKSNIDKLKRIQSELNRRLILENTITLNDFYYELGLDPVDAGYYLEWDILDGDIEMEFSSQLSEDGTPCLVISFAKPPKWSKR